MRKTKLDMAKKAKKDEFYTQLTDIEKEMQYYINHFKDKIVLCNCDNPFESNFFKYFVLNFNRLGLKKLIATCYVDSTEQVSLLFGDKNESDTKSKNKHPYKAVVTKVYDKTGDVTELFKSNENELTVLKGNGDFRSNECIELLKEADIVVTNPPFSLFREYIALLMDYEKKFIIMGHINAVKYKKVFPLIKENKVWIGVSIHSGDRKFYVPNDYPLNAAGCGIDEDGKRIIRVNGVRWYTNLGLKQHHEEMVLVKQYTPEEYPKYDNYDAINIDKTSDIPCDYDGYMGVPITFLDKYNPDQFEIIDASNNLKHDGMSKKFVDTYYKQGKGRIKEGNRALCYYDKEGNAVVPYARIIIRNKHPKSPKEI